MSKIYELKYLGNKKLIPVQGHEYSIGRDVGNDIILSDSTVSRKHALISYNGRDCIIKDLNSKNGTFVNDNKISKKRLQDKDLITIGGIPITVISKQEIIESKQKRNLSDYTAYSEDSIIIHKKFAQLMDEVGNDSELAEKLKDFQNAVDFNRKKLKTAATIDPLTGIYNRGYFDKFLHNEILRDARYGHEFSLLLIDIDFFKNINDKYGHPQGDKILKWLATQFKLLIRQTDVVARYGGEEFAIILVETSTQQAEKVAEKIREKVEIASQFELIEQITISIGISGYPANGVTDKEILQAADMGLYQSKQNGRNRITTSKLN